MYTRETVLIHTGINDDESQSNTEKLLSNIKYMVDKCHKFGVKKILISGLVFTTRVTLEVLEKIHEKLLLIIETLEGYIFVKTISIYYNQVKRFYVIILFHI